MTLLLLCFLLPLFGSLVLLFIPRWNLSLIRSIALNVSILTFILSLLLWIQFDNSTGKFQFMSGLGLVKSFPSDYLASLPNEVGYISPSGEEEFFSTLNFIIGIDGISLFL